MPHICGARRERVKMYSLKNSLFHVHVSNFRLATSTFFEWWNISLSCLTDHLMTWKHARTWNATTRLHCPSTAIRLTVSSDNFTHRSHISKVFPFPSKLLNKSTMALTVTGGSLRTVISRSWSLLRLNLYISLNSSICYRAKSSSRSAKSFFVSESSNCRRMCLNSPTVLSDMDSSTSSRISWFFIHSPDWSASFSRIINSAFRCPKAAVLSLDFSLRQRKLVCRLRHGIHFYFLFNYTNFSNDTISSPNTHFYVFTI